jgi:hypothetical protein
MDKGHFGRRTRAGAGGAVPAQTQNRDKQNEPRRDGGYTLCLLSFRFFYPRTDSGLRSNWPTILSALAAGPNSEIIKRGKLEWEDFAARGSKIIRFIDSQLSYHFLFHLTLPTDLVGHERYLKV